MRWLFLKPCMCALQTKHRYHVRVLIPCYNETQEMVAATVQAAYNAKMPAGCDKTIYLCDDGKDKNKRKWCALPPSAHSSHAFHSCFCTLKPSTEIIAAIGMRLAPLRVEPAC